MLYHVISQCILLYLTFFGDLKAIPWRHVMRLRDFPLRSRLNLLLGHDGTKEVPPFDDHRKSTGKPWEKHGKTIGKGRENHRKRMGTPQEKDRKTIGKGWRSNLILWDLPSGKRLHIYGKSQFFNWKNYYKWFFSLAMLNYQRVIVN